MYIYIYIYTGYLRKKYWCGKYYTEYFDKIIQIWLTFLNYETLNVHDNKNPLT